MSIGYNSMYGIAAGIFTAFSSKGKTKRTLSVNHSIEKKENMKILFSVNKYNLDTKENFIVYNLYINFKHSPSSLVGLLDKLRDLDVKEALKFKNEIINYNKFLKDDIDRINLEESSVDINYMLNEYRMKRIYWFTLYFYIETSNEKGASIEEISKSRINEKLIRNIERLLLYVSFSEKTKESVKELIKDRINI